MPEIRRPSRTLGCSNENRIVCTPAGTTHPIKSISARRIVSDKPSAFAFHPSENRSEITSNRGLFAEVWISIWPGLSKVIVAVPGEVSVDVNSCRPKSGSRSTTVAPSGSRQRTASRRSVIVVVFDVSLTRGDGSGTSSQCGLLVCCKPEI